jgi:hypothetical protein
MSFANLTDAVAAAVDQWIMKHHVFIVERFFKNDDSDVKTQ